MASVISITDYVHITYSQNFEASEGHDSAGEPSLILDFAYSMNGEILEEIVNESRHKFTECSPSSLRSFILETEPLPLSTMLDPEEAEICREKISDAVASLVDGCAGVEGLKMLHVDVVVEIGQEEEEDSAYFESEDVVDLEREWRMSLLRKNVCTVKKENEFCPICLNEMRVGEEVVCTPCVHRFHLNCLGRWFERTGNCPLCRFHIGPL